MLAEQKDETAAKKGKNPKALNLTLPAGTKLPSTKAAKAEDADAEGETEVAEE